MWKGVGKGSRERRLVGSVAKINGSVDEGEGGGGNAQIRKLGLLFFARFDEIDALNGGVLLIGFWYMGAGCLGREHEWLA